MEPQHNPKIKPIYNPKPRTAAAAKSLQSCLTLCDPIDGSPPGFPVPGILQARALEWGAIAFSESTPSLGLSSTLNLTLTSILKVTLTLTLALTLK